MIPMAFGSYLRVPSYANITEALNLFQLRSGLYPRSWQLWNMTFSQRLSIHYLPSSNLSIMSRLLSIFLLLSCFSFLSSALTVPPLQAPLAEALPSTSKYTVSIELFNDLEELSRIVDISYCVGLTGTEILKPFLCASRCQDFPSFELVTVGA